MDFPARSGGRTLETSTKASAIRSAINTIARFDDLLMTTSRSARRNRRLVARMSNPSARKRLAGRSARKRARFAHNRAQIANSGHQSAREARTQGQEKNPGKTGRRNVTINHPSPNLASRAPPKGAHFCVRALQKSASASHTFIARLLVGRCAKPRDRSMRKSVAHTSRRSPAALVVDRPRTVREKTSFLKERSSEPNPAAYTSDPLRA